MLTSGIYTRASPNISDDMLEKLQTIVSEEVTNLCDRHYITILAIMIPYSKELTALAADTMP